MDLDVEMVSAVCRLCTIYPIEANSAGGSDLEKAEAEGVSLSARIATNSRVGGSKFCTHSDGQYTACGGWGSPKGIGVL